MVARPKHEEDERREATSKRREGKPRRSKGCTTCIQRKVKCDEVLPTCGQCAKGGRKCSGMASAIFENTYGKSMVTTTTFIPREHNPNENKPIPEQKLPGHQNSWATPVLAKNSQVMTSQFLSFFTKVTPSRDLIFDPWMGQLLEMDEQSLLGESVAAASTIYYGQQKNDKKIMIEAYRLYETGLMKQGEMLEDISKTKRIPTVTELCAPLLLSYFEIACCTSQSAYLNHLLGAATLLESYGPGKCTEGILFELFYALRLQLNYACIVKRASSPFSTLEWLSKPFVGRHKSQTDTLIDSITICISLHSRVENLRLKPSPQDREIRIEIQNEAHSQETKLVEIGQQRTNQGWDVPGIDRREQIDGDTSITTVELPHAFPISRLPISPALHESPRAADSNAISLNFYSTACVLALSCLHLLNAEPRRYEEQMTAHCESILLTVGYHSKMDKGYMYIKLTLPLQVVGSFSPNREQRERARALLTKWKEMKVMAGICEIGLERLDLEMAGENPI